MGSSLMALATDWRWLSTTRTCASLKVDVEIHWMRDAVKLKPGMRVPEVPDSEGSFFPMEKTSLLQVCRNTNERQRPAGSHDDHGHVSSPSLLCYSCASMVCLVLL